MERCAAAAVTAPSGDAAPTNRALASASARSVRSPSGMATVAYGQGESIRVIAIAVGTLANAATLPSPSVSMRPRRG